MNAGQVIDPRTDQRQSPRQSGLGAWRMGLIAIPGSASGPAWVSVRGGHSAARGHPPPPLPSQHGDPDLRAVGALHQGLDCYYEYPLTWIMGLADLRSRWDT
jgi:hypothetical protein